MNESVTAGLSCEAEILQQKVVRTQRPISITDWLWLMNNNVNTKVPKHSTISLLDANLIRSMIDISLSISIK
jgi:hypothetical protein